MHDSPDYYKLKCSVFNDDKKTDLIGEAWIDLTPLIVPGGGQNDLWHQLQFKGKYAGDVRMELTYYDTRPKEGMIKEKKKEKLEHSRPKSNINELPDPRRFGPREVKRRPLPTDPLTPAPVSTPNQPELIPASVARTNQPEHVPAPVSRPNPPEHIHSAPLPQDHQNDLMHNPQQVYDEQWAPDSRYHILTNNETSYSNNIPEDQFINDPPHIVDEPGQIEGKLHSDYPPHDLPSYDNLDRPSDLEDPDGLYLHSAPSSFPTTPAQPMHNTSFVDERRHSAQQSIAVRHTTSPYSMPVPYGSSPPSIGREGAAPTSSDQQNFNSFRRQSTSPIKNDVFRDSPLRQSISQHDIDPPFDTQHDVSEDEGPPPPPPVHRSHIHNPSSPPDSLQDMPPVQIPQPLNLSSRGRQVSPFDRSPLQNIEHNYNPEHRNPVQSFPTSTEKEHAYPPYSKPTYSYPTYSTINPRTRGNSYDRPLSGIENTPPSLRSGYGRSVEEPDENGMENNSPSHRHSLVQAAPPRSRENSMIGNSSSPYQPPRVEDEHQTFTSEPPYVNPRVVSPDPRIVPKRKAVSPQPLPEEDGPRLSSVPFGPDSYEIFNPSSPLSASVSGPGKKYETPEQALEAARQHEVQKLRDQGPIIGNDGRVIDPTDHLPTDTWAPEPERKNRKPEVVIRYKTKETTPRTPRGYGSSPASARPHSIAGPMYGSSPLTRGSPTNSTHQMNSRNRVPNQMPVRPLPVQPYQQTNSSPAVPTTNYHTPSPRSSYPTRPDLSEYSLYDQHNQRSNRGGSPGGSYIGAPPIPDKVPISPVKSYDGHGGYGGMDALSAELSTIDIGGGMGSRGGKTRHGYGF